MATAVLDVCPLDDVLDPGGTEPGGLQDKAVEGRSTAQIETALYADTALSKEQPSYQEEFNELSIENATAASEAYVCEWTRTYLSVASPPNSNEEHYLYLPVRVTTGAPDGYSYEESKGYVNNENDVSNQLCLAALNKYLASTPSFSQHNLFSPSGSEFNTLGQLHHVLTATNSGRIINVLQGEIAHCTPSQADVLVSDDATTCHIVALRSICRNNLGKDAGEQDKHVLATMTHVDGTGYEPSLRDAVMEHVKYHSGHQVNQNEGTEMDQCKNINRRLHHNCIDISIHVMGGFNDAGGSSIKLTEDILQVFSRLAREFYDYAHPPIALHSLYHAAEKYWERRPRVTLKLETCVVCEANDNGTGCPIGRGLGLEVATGKVFLAEVEENNLCSLGNTINKTGMELIALDGDLHVLGGNHHLMSAEGPEVLLRSVRLWASAFHPSNKFKNQQKLYVIHRPDNDCVTVEPFFFGPHPSAKYLLYMDDARLLQMTSTSPLVEKPNFASKVRESLGFMNRTNNRNIFEIVNKVQQSLEYRRVGLNGWVRVK